MRLLKRLLGIAAVTLAAAVMTAQPALADQYIGNANGASVFYDDGSFVVYDARGGVITMYDKNGNVIYEDGDTQYSESEFKSLFYSGNSSKKNSSKNNKYAGSTINDAYWDYTSGRCTARWEADNQSHAKYTVTLYRDDHKVTSKTSSGGKSVDFTDTIANSNRTGEYTFVVKAKWTGGYTDEEGSDELYVNDYELNQIRSRNNSNANSNSNSTIGGPGATPANTAGPAGNVGWQNHNGIWKYLRPNGSYAVNGWELVNGKWYYFDGSGNMAANQWVQTDAWYYVGPDGDMLVNQWIQSKGDPHIWYYVGGDGRMVTNTVVNGWSINPAGECYF